MSAKYQGNGARYAEPEGEGGEHLVLHRGQEEGGALCWEDNIHQAVNTFIHACQGDQVG